MGLAILRRIYRYQAVCGRISVAEGIHERVGMVEIGADEGQLIVFEFLS